MARRHESIEQLVVASSSRSRGARLSVLEHGYPLVAIGMFALLSICLASLVVNRRSPGRLRSMLARVALAGSTTLLVLILIECSVAAYLSWLHRLPHLAMVHGSARPAASDDATIVVVGESSAEGVPYRDWFSVGKIVAWQLRRLLPQRMFHVEVQGGPAGRWRRCTRSWPSLASAPMR